MKILISRIFRLDQDGAEPSGNSVSVQNLLRLATYLDRGDFGEKAEQVLSVFTSRLTRFPLSLPQMVCGLMFHYDSATQVFLPEVVVFRVFTLVFY